MGCTTEAAIVIIELLSNADSGCTGHLLLRFGAILVFLGLPVSLAAILVTLRNAPEGYEDEEGFHSEQSPPSISYSTGAAILRHHNAG